MRELSGQEVVMVSGGATPQTMDAGCFAATVYLGISPFFGPAAMVGAMFSVFTACHNVDFTS